MIVEGLSRLVNSRAKVQHGGGVVGDWDIGDLTVVASWLVINAGVGVVVIDVGDLRFQLHYQVRIVITSAGDVRFFWCSAAIQVGFGGFGCVSDRAAIDEGGGSVSL